MDICLRGVTLVLINSMLTLRPSRLDIIAPHARYKVWIKANGEMVSPKSFSRAWELVY